MLAATRLAASIFLASSRVFSSLSRPCLNMSTKKRVVYLEDLEGPTAKAVATAVSKDTSEVQHPDGATSCNSETNLVGGGRKTTTTTAVKRQRTLMDMFSDGAPSNARAAKKLKVAATHTTATSTASALTPQPSLNSISFSLSEFQAAMSDDERKLLTLECENLGKSWCVQIVI